MFISFTNSSPAHKNFELCRVQKDLIVSFYRTGLSMMAQQEEVTYVFVPPRVREIEETYEEVTALLS